MQLIKLYSDQTTFHNVIFKPGLNLIVGKQENKENKNRKNTFNGVGKSLTIYLIHFCLGSNPVSEFEKKIPGWKFFLEVSIDNRYYILSRSTSNQKVIYFNDEQLSLNKFREKMLKLVFDLDMKKRNLSFNTLFPRFIRRDKECYLSYDTFIKKENDYGKLLNNAFLLGLSSDLVESKHDLRSEHNRTESLSKALGKDDTLKNYFNYENSNSKIEKLDLKFEIENIERSIENFEISENYDEVLDKANRIKRQKTIFENKKVLLQNAIKSIEKSLTIRPDTNLNNVLKMYQEAKVSLPEMIVRDLEATTTFHKKLLYNRQKRLENELFEKKEELSLVTSTIDGLIIEMNEFFVFLNTHRAIDEYTSLTTKLSDLKYRYQKIVEYEEILKSYKKRIQSFQSEYIRQNQETEDYLDEINDLLELIMETFRKLSKEFYDKSGGITVENNIGENMQRYNIMAKIQDDSSDGVNEVKIFCFDMTVLLLQQNHNMKFIFHDSRLFSNMDPRQRYTLFKLAFEKTSEKSIQYIASVNEDLLDSMKELPDTNEFNKVIYENVILELTDYSEKTKLLGIQVDMDYEK